MALQKNYRLIKVFTLAIFSQMVISFRKQLCMIKQKRR